MYRPRVQGVAYVMHAVTMCLVGYLQSAREYIELAKECQPEDGKSSDFLSAYIMAGLTFYGQYNDLDMAIANGAESIPLAKQLQLRSILKRQMFLTAVAAVNVSLERSETEP